jgi:hypothetical protein
VGLTGVKESCAGAFPNNSDEFLVFGIKEFETTLWAEGGILTGLRKVAMAGFGIRPLAEVPGSRVGGEGIGMVEL